MSPLRTGNYKLPRWLSQGWEVSVRNSWLAGIHNRPLALFHLLGTLPFSMFSSPALVLWGGLVGWEGEGGLRNIAHGPSPSCLWEEGSIYFLRKHRWSTCLSGDFCQQYRQCLGSWVLAPLASTFHFWFYSDTRLIFGSIHGATVMAAEGKGVISHKMLQVSYEIKINIA